MRRSRFRAQAVLAALLPVTLVGGCFVSKPPQNVGFGHVTTLRELEGRYRNLGEAKEGEPPQYLSAIIWPSSHPGPDSIATIEVRATGDTLVTVRAIGADGTTMKISTFTRGVQFDLHEGRLLLRPKSQGVVPAQDGEVILGAVFETVELGIDAHGDAKYKSTQTAAGVVYLVIPIVGGGSTEVRFRRLN